MKNLYFCGALVLLFVFTAQDHVLGQTGEFRLVSKDTGRVLPVQLSAKKGEATAAFHINYGLSAIGESGFEKKGRLLYVAFNPAPFQLNKVIELGEGSCVDCTFDKKASLGASAAGIKAPDGTYHVLGGVPGRTTFDANGKKLKFAGGVFAFVINTELNITGGYWVALDPAYQQEKKGYFGSAMIIDGNTLFVSAVGEDWQERDGGAVYQGELVFDDQPGQYSLQAMSRIEPDSLVLQKKQGFGADIVCLGDVDNDGYPDLAISSSGFDGVNKDEGSVDLVELGPTTEITASINSLTTGFPLQKKEGAYALGIGHVDDNDGVDLRIGSRGYNDGREKDAGIIRSVVIEPSGRPTQLREITLADFGKTPQRRDEFGKVLAKTPNAIPPRFFWEDVGIVAYADKVFMFDEPETGLRDLDSLLFAKTLTAVAPEIQEGPQPPIDVIGSHSQQVKVFPNPTQGFVKVDLPESEIKNITVFSLAGKEAFQSQDAQIDLSHLPAGIYTLRIQNALGEVLNARVYKN